MELKNKLIFIFVCFYQFKFNFGFHRNFLRGMALGVLFGKNIFNRHLGNNNPIMPPPPPPPSCPIKPQCSKNDKNDNHQPVQNTYPVYVNNPTYHFQYPPLLLDDQSLNEFLNNNRRILRILRS